MARRLRLGKSPDLYLTELRKLSVLFGVMTDSDLTSAFMVGLPGRVKQLLRASSRMDVMAIDLLLARTRANMKDMKQKNSSPMFHVIKLRAISTTTHTTQ